MKKRVLAVICLSLLCFGCGNSEKAAEADNKEQTPVIEINDGSDDADKDAPGAPVSEEHDAAAADQEDTGSTEDTAGEDTDLTARDLFADFISGKGAAVVSDDFLSAMNMIEVPLNPGYEFTVSEFESLLQKDEMIGNTAPKVSYAPLKGHDGKLYAMQLLFETDIESITETLVFKDSGKSLDLLFAIDSWTRRYAALNEDGVVSDDGSNGAGSHSYVTYVPDQNAVYKKVSDVDEEYYGFSFYDETGNPVEPLNTIMEEAGEGNPRAQDIAYYREIINGKTYYYFLKGSESGSLTQDTVEYIDKVAKSHDFTFDGKSAADEARSAYEKELGVEDACLNQTEPAWKNL